MGSVRLRLEKMPHAPGEQVQYHLGPHRLNDALGRRLRLAHTGRISCVACERAISKTFGDGYCYPCFSSLARCDNCIVRPHTCHFHLGTCREPAWGQAHCLIPHVVYLARTSGVKVGVTGAHKTHERWGDQGAVEAQVLARTPDRLTAGRLEHLLAQHMSDRTAWQKLVTGRFDALDFAAVRAEAEARVPPDMRDLILDDGPPETLRYPVQRYCPKAKTAKLDKQPVIEGVLHGIRGQYLFISDLAFNVRSHAGFEVDLSL